MEMRVKHGLRCPQSRPAGALREAGADERRVEAVRLGTGKGVGGTVPGVLRGSAGEADRGDAICFTIPIRTVSALNAREYWRARAKRVKAERSATAWMLTAHKPPELPVTVTLTRVGPTNGLDEGDNLNSAFKGVRDQIAQWLGVDDRSALVTWKYGQRRGKDWAVEVAIACA